MFRSNMLPTFSGSMNKPGKKTSEVGGVMN
jgi:hypothetical protein